MLTLERLRKTYGSQVAVAGLDLVVPRGCIVGLVGNNGAGKTTTIKMVCGLVQPTSGFARIDGQDTRRPATRAALGYVPEDSPLYAEQTPRQYLRFFAQIYKLPRSTWQERIPHLLGRLRLDEAYWDKPIGDLSKGSARKVAIARALLHDPAVLVLDEPASGLDPATRRELDAVILDLRAAGKSVLMSAHNLRQVEELCDIVVILHEGRIVAQGPLALLRETWGEQHYSIHATIPFATQSATAERRGGVYVTQVRGNDALNEALEAIRQGGGSVVEVESHPPTLDEILARASAAP